jgi:L-iditol 2-dehydrogenase
MPDKMKAAWLYAPHDLRVEDVDMPSIDDAKALVKIKTCGVCPSDVRFYTGARKNAVYPRIAGHEWTGEIVEAGSAVNGFAPGDRVVADWRVICGECYYCRRGIFNYCNNLKHDEMKGGFCEYGYAPRQNLRKIPDGVSFEEASFTEPLACCLNGVNRSNIRAGDDVVVVGAGQIGLMHVQLAKHLGGRVIACDRVQRRLEKAKAVGADDVINVSEGDTIEAVHDLTEGRGANVVIVAASATKAAELGLEMADICGTVNFFAGFYPSNPIAVDPNVIHYKQLNVTGSHDFTPHDFTSALKLIEHGIINVKTLISHRLPLDELEQGFDTVIELSGVKVMIEVEDGRDGR